MDYKTVIIEMLESITEEKALKAIYLLVQKYFVEK